MPRDNFSMLFANAGVAPTPTPALKEVSSSDASTEAAADNGDRSGSFNGSNGAGAHQMQSSAQADFLSMPGGHEPVTAADAPSSIPDPATAARVTVPAPITTNNETLDNNTMQRSPSTAGTETRQYLKKIVSPIGSALKPLRELQLAEKLNSMSSEIERWEQHRDQSLRDRQLAKELDSMNAEMEKAQDDKEVERQRRYLEEKDRGQHQHVQFRKDDEMEGASEQLARELQDQEEQEECERIKMEADLACKRVAGRYDALVKFTNGCPHGNYEEFVEFLLMGGGRRPGQGPEEDYDSLMFENFYDEHNEYRNLWNDNLTMGLPEGASTLDGRAFVPATSGNASGGDDAFDPWHTLSAEGSGSGRQRTFSEDERLRNFGQTIRNRTLSEGERIKNQLAQVDKEKIKQGLGQGLGSAVNAISSVSTFALKPLRDLQLAEKLNAMNIDMEEEEARKEIEQYNMMQQEKMDLEEAMRLKREAEESCMNATREHLLGFIKENPDAKYHEWIEAFHPENAHAGTLLEGLGKTIDHRFFVEESDHRKMWNENLLTFLDPETSKGRDFVPARARQFDDNGEMVVAADILSGSLSGDGAVVHRGGDGGEKPDDARASLDLIAFD